MSWGWPADLGDVVITVVSQSHALHVARVRDRRQQWLKQLHRLTVGVSPVQNVIFSSSIKMILFSEPQ